MSVRFIPIFPARVAHANFLTVNVGILGYASYALYSSPSLRRDTRTLSIGGISLLSLFGLEGYAAEQYAQTSRGRSERKRARKEGE